MGATEEARLDPSLDERVFVTMDWHVRGGHLPWVRTAAPPPPFDLHQWLKEVAKPQFVG